MGAKGKTNKGEVASLLGNTGKGGSEQVGLTKVEPTKVEPTPIAPKGKAEKKEKLTPNEEASRNAKNVEEEKKEIRSRFYNQWAYVPHAYNGATGDWYQWTGTHWQRREQTDFYTFLRDACQEIIMKEPDTHHLVVKSNPQQYYTNFASPERILICQTVLHHERPIPKTDEEFENLDLHRGINFANGFYDLKTKKLEIDRKPTRTPFVDYVLTASYSPSTLPNMDLLHQLYATFGYRKESLWLLRAFLQRGLFPNMDLQTGLILIGQGSTGKSIIENFFQTVFGTSNCGSIDAYDIGRKFMVANLAMKRYGIVPDVDKFSSRSVELTKQLMGRDIVPSSVKYVQPTFDFKFFGTFIFASNKTYAELIVDPALASRFTILEFAKTSTALDITFKKRLLKDATALINWAMGMPKEDANQLIRADVFTSGIGADDTPIGRFISEYLVFDKKGYAVSQMLTDIFNQNREQLGYTSGSNTKPISSSALLSQIVALSFTIWKKSILEVKGNSRFWFLDIDNAKQEALSSDSYGEEDKRAFDEADHFVPMKPQPTKKDKKLVCLAGIRFRLPHEKSASTQIPNSHEGREFDPFAWEAWDEQSSEATEKWANFKAEFYKKVPTVKKGFQQNLDYEIPDFPDT